MKTMKPGNRRKFLLTAGLGSAGAAALVVAGGKKAASAGKIAEAQAQPSGYHASEHIKKYYETTKV